MILPNKITPFNKSIIAKTPYILDEIKDAPSTISHLFEKTKEHFEDINAFICAMDVLYVLEKIDVDFAKGEVSYVKNN